MQTNLFPTDICVKRHRNNSASVDANTRANKVKPRDRIRILDFAIKSGGRIWLKQIERELGMLRNSASGRLAEMKMLGMLEPTGDRIEGCSVLKLVIK